MTKHCECHVISFPASMDQCHWVAIAGSHSIVRYGLGTGGQHEGIVFTTLTYPYMILPQYLPIARKTGQLIRQICWYNPYINRNFKLGSLIFQLQWAVHHKTSYGSRTIEDSVLAIPALQRLYIDLNIHLVIDMRIIDFIYNYFN